MKQSDHAAAAGADDLAGEPEEATADPLQVLYAELVQGGRSGQYTREVDRWRWRHFRRWCTLRGLPAEPGSEQTLLRYLQAHQPHWSWGTARTTAFSVQRLHLEHELATPLGDGVKAYLGGLRQLLGERVQSPVDALRSGDLERMVTALRESEMSPPPAIAVGQAALVAAARLRLHLPGVRAEDAAAVLTGVEIAVGDHEVRLRSGRGRWQLVDAVGEPYAYRALSMVAAWRSLGASPPPTAGARWTAPYLAWRRAGFGALGRPTTLPHLDDPELDWLLANVDAGLYRRRRNCAYLVLGVRLALRHADLSRFGLTDVTPSQGGYDVLVRCSKSDPHGRRPPRPVRHDRDMGVPEAVCGSQVCPACAVDDLLEVVRRGQGRTDGVLLATRYRGQWRSMTRQNGRLVIRAAWQGADLHLDSDAPLRISTRTVRITGATQARQSGMSVAEVAEHVTLHKDPNTTLLYDRTDPGAGYQLDL